MLPAIDDLPVGRSWMLVPARTHTELDAPTVRLHSVQSPEAYVVLASTGTLTGDPGRVDTEFREAYAWLAREMDRRLPTTGDSMLWAWARIRRRDLARDLSKQPGSVLLTLEVSRERLLLHSYGDWHVALNRGLHTPPVPGESLEEWSRRTDPICAEFDARVDAAVGGPTVPLARWPQQLRAEIESSWEAIFDPATWDPGTAVQATVHRIEATDVVRAVRVR